MTVALSTSRLALRMPRESDLSAMIAHGQSESTRFAGGTADAFQIWRALLANVGHWSLRGYGFFSVDAGKNFVGRVGVVFHHGWPEPELAWHLFDEFEGHGYATEAAHAARDWYYATIAQEPLISMVGPENHAARKVCERLGAYLERLDIIHGQPVGVWRHPGPEALK